MTIDTSTSELNEHADSFSAQEANGLRVNEENEISLLDLLILLAERKRLIFWVTAAFAILAVIISLVLPERYTATVTLLPPQQNSSIGAALASQLGNL